MMADIALSPEEDEEDIVDLDEGQASPEPEEQVENIIEDTDSQPDKPKAGGYRRLVNRLRDAKQTTRATAEELAIEREKRKMLELALEQQKEARSNVLPDPMSFDDGTADPKYQEAMHAYTSELVKQEVRNFVPQAKEPDGSEELEQLQIAHSERADKLNIADYADVQDAAIETLGLKTVNDIISISDRSEVVLYYLGKNPDKAEELLAMTKKNPAKAVIEIGRLEERLKVKPRASSQPAPDPDEEIVGSSGSGSGRRGPAGATFE
eukprot:GHVR01104718.1.p2 GENE.GHVR01104718.1~~GHVR01104718.1.p2  ORF type:complete len:266 (+),score=43.78 GHVR01104718.1:218-1015(+)